MRILRRASWLCSVALLASACGADASESGACAAPEPVATYAVVPFAVAIWYAPDDTSWYDAPAPDDSSASDPPTDPAPDDPSTDDTSDTGDDSGDDGATPLAIRPRTYAYGGACHACRVVCTLSGPGAPAAASATATSGASDGDACRTAHASLERWSAGGSVSLASCGRGALGSP